MTIRVAAAQRSGKAALEAQVAERALTIGRRTALGVLGDAEAAADVAQDVALIALRRLRRLKDPERLDAWLHRVATREALRSARRSTQRRRREDSHVRLHEDRGGEATEPGDLAALQLLTGLPHEQRAALTLRYVHDLSDAAIAKALGCREGTVRSLLSRGRAALRARLELEDDARSDHA